MKGVFKKTLTYNNFPWDGDQNKVREKSGIFKFN